MEPAFKPLDPRQLPLLLRGEASLIGDWIGRGANTRVLFQVVVIVLGAGVFGAAVGSWRDPQQSLFLAIKLPLILGLTAAGNGLINGMLAPLLGLNISFRQSLLLVLMSFTIASAILAAFSPIVLFMIWNTPTTATSGPSFYFTLLFNVAIIAFAGIAASLRLFGLLNRLSGNRQIARKVLLAWLAGNLFLGAQISWNLRPFIGSPEMDVQFMRDDAFAGTFYESIIRVIQGLVTRL